jgi:hypothetical protein
MIYQTYIPPSPLGDFVDWFWYYEGFCPGHTKERILPHGVLELVIDLQSKPKRLFDREDPPPFRSQASDEFNSSQGTLWFLFAIHWTLSYVLHITSTSRTYNM